MRSIEKNILPSCIPVLHFWFSSGLVKEKSTLVFVEGEFTMINLEGPFSVQ